MGLFWSWSAFEALHPHELYESMALRQAVFVVEQACPYLDADGLDPRAHHLLGRIDGVLVAYLRAFAPDVLYPGAACIGRVVTASPIRGQGHGRPLMREGMRRVSETWGAGPVKLAAQAHLEGYYASLGFEVCGPGYDEDGIPHLPMLRSQSP